MMADELAEINGHKPKIVLADGEEKEVGSLTSKSVYKVKRTFDHFYCTCPAWRNQSGVPVNARTCKHIKSLLGDDYEAARIHLKNPNAPPPKGAAAKKAAAKPASRSTKTPAKRKKVDEDDDLADGNDNVDEKPAKRTRSKPASTSRGKKAAIKEEDDEDEEEEEVVVKPPARGSRKPASTSRGKKLPPKEDDEEEEAEVDTKPARTTRKAPTSRSKKAPADEEDEDAGAKPTKAVVKAAPTSSGKKATKDVEDEDDDDDDDVADAKPAKAPLSAQPADELAEIDGIKPKVILKDGEEKEVSSMSSNSVYKVKRTWDHFYCTCPAWRNQSGFPVNARTCKHIKSLLGDKYEEARLKLKNPHGPPPKPSAAKRSTAKPASRSTKTPAKRKKADEEDEDEDEDGGGDDDGAKPAKKPRSKPASSSRGKGKAKKGDDDDEEDENENEDDAAPPGKSVPELLLANKWDLEKGPDPTGWWISEKLDGVRVFYDGKDMYSRLGNPFTPPKWFLDKLPHDLTLDGELFGGRGEFQSTVSIVKTINSPHWKNISFQIFDVPSRGDDPFEDRISFLQKTFGVGGSHAAEQIEVVQHEIAKDRQHVLDKLKEIESLGGEGLMLRKPQSQYEGKRSGTLLKIKTFYDAEAIVTGYVPGKGRNQGTTGALKCKMESGKTFNVGTGLSDKQRKNPPKIGAIIVYRFQELTKDGVPRFPSYIGEAADKDKPKDAEIPDHRKAGASTDD